MRTPYGHEVYAMGAEYPSASALYDAAKRVRDAGFKRWDVFSPFPIHGMDDAMGLGKSWLSAVVLAGGLSGLTTALILEFGPSWVLYPLIVHGKPYDWKTVPAFFRRWCVSRMSGPRRRSLFSPMLAGHAFRSQIRCRSVMKCRGRSGTHRRKFRPAARRLAMNFRGNTSVLASARITTTPARWGR